MTISMLPDDEVSAASMPVLPPAPVDSCTEPDEYATALVPAVHAAAPPVTRLRWPLEPPLAALSMEPDEMRTAPDTAAALSASPPAPVTREILPPAAVPVAAPPERSTAPPAPTELAPVTTLTAPPAAAELDPACAKTLPAVEAEFPELSTTSPTAEVIATWPEEVPSSNEAIDTELEADSVTSEVAEPAADSSTDAEECDEAISEMPAPELAELEADNTTEPSSPPATKEMLPPAAVPLPTPD